MATNVIIFVQGDARYAIEAALVREVLTRDELTALPPALSVDGIVGICHVRGKVLPVADLHLICGEAPPPISGDTCLRLQVGDVELLLSAQGVEEVAHLEDEYMVLEEPRQWGICRDTVLRGRKLVMVDGPALVARLRYSLSNVHTRLAGDVESRIDSGRL